MFTHHNLETISRVLRAIVNCTAVLVMMWGFGDFLKEFIIFKLGKNPKHSFLWHAQNLRLHLGSYILLGLELMIIADVIETIFSQTKEHLVILGAIVIIRTLLSHFLGKEIKEAKETLLEESKSEDIKSHES